MLLEAVKLTKSLGAKHLFQNLDFGIVPGEKVALIGRNGQGKTTLLKILHGDDHDFDGKVITRSGISITLTQQEHHLRDEESAVEYVLKNVRHYHKHKKILDDYEQGLNTNTHDYLHSVEYFTDNGYYYIESMIENTLADFQIANDVARGPLTNLSGGQKRYVEMTKMMFSQSDLLLVDEPTNHMDYKGKERFITWMKSLKSAMFVVTHDRDVLKHVHKIVELKDKTLHTFKGNYDSYIAQNSTQTLSSVKLYSDQLNRLKEAKKRVEWGLQMRAKSKQWKIRYDHWLRDYEKIKAETVKPSFWIDQNSVEELDKKVVDSYQKFKEKNIKISISETKEKAGELLTVRNLALGFEKPLFTQLNFSLKDSSRVFIKGKNGTGKSTLVRTILALSQSQEPKATTHDGEIVLGDDLRIGEYEQEISQKYLDMTLEDAIRASYLEQKVPIDTSQIKRIMAQYLFDTVMDAKQKIIYLSGGQKARFQLIKMFIGKPNLLILDEPTNHLDLPSIEELENALEKFEGGILYISHDTYFIRKMGGHVIEL
jgi:ATP-binding cassette, subfamily F, member 3